jgi:hypothetical protein
MSQIEPGSREWEVARNGAEMRSFTPEIPLTPANEILKADFIRGMEDTLFSPGSAAITIEGTDTRDNFRLGNTKFLARAAFLHLDNATAAGANRPFDLAVWVQATHLDLETVSDISEAELKGFGYDTFDGIYVELLDSLLKNHATKSLHHGPRKSRYGFRFYESGSGYAYIPGQTEDVVWSAYQINTGCGFGARRRPKLGTHLEELQVIADVLKNGQPDQTAVNNVIRASNEGQAITLILNEANEAEKVLPYMYGMFKEAVEAPDLRDEIARHQYFHVEQPDYLIR